jgi:CHAD domain-containing protein
MAGSNPWVVTDPGTRPAACVAADLLRRRLRFVWKDLRAACRKEHDSKRLHQLRVATRRTIAALEACGDLVPEKKRRWFSKRLGRIRRAAGETRDLDVLLARLANQPAPAAAAGMDPGQWPWLLGKLWRHRERSRRPLQKLLAKLSAASWPRRVDRLCRRALASATGESFADFASRSLAPILEQFCVRADRRCVGTQAMHQLRIEGKRLRYAVEVLGVALPQTARTAGLAALEEMQESLGAFVDHAAAADRFRRLAREAAGSDRRLLASLAQQEERLAETARTAFSRWWTVARRQRLIRSFQPETRRSRA